MQKSVPYFAPVFSLALCCLGFLLPAPALAQKSVAETNENLTFNGQSSAPASPLALWYRQPAHFWKEALPLGNGRLGAMVWGRVTQERVDLNEDTLWSGEPDENINTNGLKTLPAIRALLQEGRNQEAQALVEQNMCANYTSSYMPLGQLRLDFGLTNAVSNYRRELDLEQSLCRVQFKYNGVAYTREVFASHPDQAIVLRFTADRPRKLSFAATLSTPLHHEFIAPTQPPQTNATRSKGSVPVLRLTGRCPVYVDPNFMGKRIVYDDAPNGKGMRFETRLLALNEAGTVTLTNNTLVARDCTSVTLLLLAATSFNGPQKSPSADGLDPATLCDTVQTSLLTKAYRRLYRDHVQDYQSLFSRVHLELGTRQTPRTGTNAPVLPATLPTDQRLTNYQAAQDPALAALYYQFGRYLLISCSRAGSQPANLQGLWNYQMQPAWAANWTLNCNAEINYWPVETANLGECHLPLIALTRELSVDGEHIASRLYGTHGWVAHHCTDIWRHAGPVGGSPCWSMFPVGSAWLCQHLWEHYAFAGDTNYLAEVWPTLRGAARFYLDNLIEEPSHHWLVTAPDNNFENHWRKPNGETGCTCMGATASMQMVRELFTNCRQASILLGQDLPLRTELEAALPRLAPMQVSPTSGELQEWLDDWQRTSECQVLSSWGLICSAQISPRSTPQLAAALRKIFDSNPWWQQGKVGSWQGAFQANAYARLGDGEMAVAILDTHLHTSVNPNFTGAFPGHTQYQIDGNLGQTAAIGEMLLQSQTSETVPASSLSAAKAQDYRVIQLLPALPSEWANGSVRGLRARGGFNIDIAWRDGHLVEATIRSLQGNPCRVRLGNSTLDLQTRPGTSYVLDGQLRLR